MPTIDRILPLRGAEVTETRSVDQARLRLSRAYRPHTLTPGWDHDRFLFRHHTVRLDRASLNTLEYGAEVHIDPGDFDSFYMIEFPLSGSVRGQFGGETFVSSSHHGQILSPGRPIRSVWATGTRQLMLRVDEEAMRRRLSDLTGLPVRRAPVFRPTFALDTALGHRIVTLMKLLAAETALADRDSEAGPASTPLIDALLASLLRHQPHDKTASLEAGSAPSAPAHVARAAAYMEANAAQPLTVAAVAKIVGVSERALMDGFRRFRGTSPYAFLQARRLDRALKMLADSSEAMPIADIGRTCGLPHAGRFAEAYRIRFGESPSQTRRRLSDSRAR
jgi:AraC-like DNA-binding protein